MLTLNLVKAPGQFSFGTGGQFSIGANTHSKKPRVVRGSVRLTARLSELAGLVLAEQKRFEWSLPNLFQMD